MNIEKRPDEILNFFAKLHESFIGRSVDTYYVVILGQGGEEIAVIQEQVNYSLKMEGIINKVKLLPMNFPDQFDERVFHGMSCIACILPLRLRASLVPHPSWAMLRGRMKSAKSILGLTMARDPVFFNDQTDILWDVENEVFVTNWCKGPNPETRIAIEESRNIDEPRFSNGKELFESLDSSLPVQGGRTLDNTNISEAKKAIPDLQVVGNGDMWQLLCKASSKEQKWMKSTKAMYLGPKLGCLIQVTTQQQNLDGTWVIAEAITHAPRTSIVEDINGGRKLVIE